MTSNKNKINSYLKESKDKYPKEALVEELKKAGYGEMSEMRDRFKNS